MVQSTNKNIKIMVLDSIYKKQQKEQSKSKCLQFIVNMKLLKK